MCTRPTTLHRTGALLLASVAVVATAAACREEHPTQRAESKPAATLAAAEPATQSATAEPGAVANLDAPRWPQEAALPAELADLPESFGEMILEPGRDKTVCSMRLWTEGGVLHGGLLPDFVDAPQPGVNLRSDALSPERPFVRLGRQRYIVLDPAPEGAPEGAVEVYLDRTFWESPLELRVAALEPGARSVFWLSSAGRERLVSGDEVVIDLALVPAPADDALEGARRWALELRGRRGTHVEKVDPLATGRAYALGDGHLLELLEVRPGDASATGFDADGFVVSREPIPTLHVQLALSRTAQP